MKVTKIVREYIVDSVNAKYQPIIDAINAKYSGAKEECEKVREQTRVELNKIAMNMYRERLAPFYDEEEMAYSFDRDINLVCDPLRYNCRTIKEKKRDEEIAKISKEKEDTIKNILITLELGGTKADLDRLLSEVNPESESEEE